MGYRRIVTGDRDGRSTVRADEHVDTFVTDVADMDWMWRSEAVPSVPTNQDPDRVFAIPPPGGVWVMSWVLQPGSTAAAENDIVDMTHERPGFHRTDSVDVNVVLQGTAVLELDDGVEVELKAGDAIVLNGNMHAWHNRTSDPVRLHATIVGAHRR
jgi:quercetin dioxygenase-like cupin family protein